LERRRRAREERRTAGLEECGVLELQIGFTVQLDIYISG
jgi:hypothetical protein